MAKVADGHHRRDEVAARRRGFGGHSVVDGMGGVVASAGRGVEGTGRKPALHGIRMSEVAASRFNEQVEFRLVGWPSAEVRMVWMPASKASAKDKVAYLAVGGSSVPEEKGSDSLTPCSPDLWTCLAWPQQSALGRQRSAFPGRRKNASSVGVADFRERFHLEIEAAEVEKLKLGVFPTEGEEGFHEVGVSPSKGFRKSEKGRR
jgi:hypothetical protein